MVVGITTEKLLHLALNLLLAGFEVGALWMLCL
jgi:hypothetical protein